MPTRDDLIARKGEVQARIRSLRRQLDAASEQAQGATGVRRAFLSARVSSLRSDLDSLMAEEARLRLEIDRAPH